MDKYKMRLYVADLESLTDAKLKLWKKIARVENGESVQIEWQFEESRVIIDIFWMGNNESVQLQCLRPREESRYHWQGLDKESLDHVEDRVGHFAQIVMYPAKRYMNDPGAP